MQTCLCLFKGARTITRTRTSAFVHIMCVLCVQLCTPVHTCVVHACSWAVTGYNVLQCYKKMVTVQPCEYILLCNYTCCSNSCAVVTGVTAPCTNMDVWHRVKHPAAPARFALYQSSPHAVHMHFDCKRGHSECMDVKMSDLRATQACLYTYLTLLTFN